MQDISPDVNAIIDACTRRPYGACDECVEAAIKAAVREEREACARIGDAIFETKDHPVLESTGAEWYAAAIRARNQQ